MWVPIQKAWVEPNQSHKFGGETSLRGRVANIVHDQWFAQNIKNRHARAQRAERVLKYKLHFAAEGHQRVAFESANVD